MILFHGTREKEMKGILRQGLLPPDPATCVERGAAVEESSDWCRRLSGLPQCGTTFLSTAPVAGKGGIRSRSPWAGRNPNSAYRGRPLVIRKP